MPVQQQVACPCVRLGVGRLHEEVDRVRGGEAGILGAEGLEPREDAGVVGPQEELADCVGLAKCHVVRRGCDIGYTKNQPENSFGIGGGACRTHAGVGSVPGVSQGGGWSGQGGVSR